MNFKDLTELQIDFIKSVYTDTSMSWDDRMAVLMKFLNKSERTVRLWCSKKLGLSKKTEVESDQLKIAKNKVFDKEKKRFIVTWAQNNTPVHAEFLNNIEAYAKFINADIHVIAGRYKNPTSVWTQKQENEEFWDDAVLSYLDYNRHDIHKYVSILSDVRIQPTAVNPMSGMQGFSGVNSCIFGSPKVQLETIPVLEGNKPKLMVTTGAVTKMNYTDSKAGKKGEFHHVYGFVIVEIKDDETFYIRQVTADDKHGNFTDLFYQVKNGHINKINEIEAIVLGDLHYGMHDQDVLDETYKFLTNIKPTHVVLHDVFDGDSISHHQIKDPFTQYGKEINGSNDLKKEIDFMLEKLSQFEEFENVVIVRSNHDDFIDRWLKNEDWKRQPTPKNSRLYMQLSDLLLDQYEKSPSDIKGVIPALINNKYPKFKTLKRSDSYKVLNWELGQHGDIGSGGSRGTLQQYRSINTKTIVAHYHKPARKDGALSVGTSTKLRVGYNIGPSDWAQAHAIIHKDGKAQHIIFSRDSKNNLGYTTFEY
jgi:hypothetical protein